MTYVRTMWIENLPWSFLMSWWPLILLTMVLFCTGCRGWELKALFIVVLFFPHWLVLVSSDQREEISTDTQKHGAILDNTGDSVFCSLGTVKVYMGGNRLTLNLSQLELLFVALCPLHCFWTALDCPWKEVYIFGVFLDSGLLLEIHWHGWLPPSVCYTYFVGPGFSLGSECSLKC